MNVKCYFILLMGRILSASPDPRPIFTTDFADTVFRKKATYNGQETSDMLGLGIAALGEGDTWQYENDTDASNANVWRMPFTITVDDFTALTILGSYNTDWWKNGTHIWFEGTGWKGFSKLKRYKNAAGDMVVPQLTIIIQVKDGKIVGMAWDDAHKCLGCSESECVDGFCAVHETKCGVDSVTCDLKIYIGWIGTDAKGNYMTSAGRRLSQFRNYSLKSTFDVAYKTYQDEVPKEMQDVVN